MENLNIIDLSGTDFDIWEPESGKCYANLPNEIYHGLKDWNGSSMLKHGLRSVESYPHIWRKTLSLQGNSALLESPPGAGGDTYLWKKSLA